MLILVSHLYNAGHYVLTVFSLMVRLYLMWMSAVCAFFAGEMWRCASLSASSVFFFPPQDSLIFHCYSAPAVQIKLISNRISCARMCWRRMRAPEDSPLLHTASVWSRKRGDGWRELALQAHLMQLWKRSIAPSLSLLILLCPLLSANTASLLLPSPLSMTCRAHALCVFATQQMHEKGAAQAYMF